MHGNNLTHKVIKWFENVLEKNRVVNWEVAGHYIKVLNVYSKEPLAALSFSE